MSQKRKNSPIPDLPDTSSHQYQPSSPASSSASQTSCDTTFEPSIDMMVNDFDDEQTLTEEEALAELESEEPMDEIETLQKESEIPLDKLLAQYRHQQQRHMSTKSIKRHNSHLSRKSKHARLDEQEQGCSSKSTTIISNSTQNTIPMPTRISNKIPTRIPIRIHPQTPNRTPTPIPTSIKTSNSKHNSTAYPTIVIEESDDEELDVIKTEENNTDFDEKDDSSAEENEFEGEEDLAEDENQEQDEDDFDCCEEEFETELEEEHQPEGGVDYEIEENDDDDSEDEVTENSPDQPEKNKMTALALLYPDKYANIQHESSEEDEEVFKKTMVMVGSDYQALIPSGLSKYGDVLPYENEDQLVWEPSQVNEEDVEDFLLKVRDLSIAPQHDVKEEDSVASDNDQPSTSSLIKDDEEALHILVQCGYNFKEALRRRRLSYATRTTGTMTIWSEDECKNFEDGIRKFGKHFRLIRQHHVKTRSIHELVQFYYLWKKSERHDSDIVDSDAIDPMDVYLNDDKPDSFGNKILVRSMSGILPFESYSKYLVSPAKKRTNVSIMQEAKGPSTYSRKRPYRKLSTSLSGNSEASSPKNSRSSSSVCSTVTSDSHPKRGATLRRKISRSD